MSFPALLKRVFEFFQKVIQNNPLLFLLVFFWLGLFMLNAFLNDQYLKVSQPPFFPGFSVLEQKKEFQSLVIRQLKKIKDLKIQIYTIQQGENYWSIARDHNVDIDTIIGLNPYLKNIYAGLDEHLLVGDLMGCLHIVQQGENLRSVAKLYHVSLQKIKKMNRINLLTEIFSPLKSRDILFIPDAKPKTLTDEMMRLFEMRNVLQSPLGGRYTSGYGIREDPFTRQKKYHNGIDIKVNVGDWVGAANDGVVIEAGWAGGYGKMVKINHDNGYVTLYGHLSRILVRVGQRVRKGQIIARAGNTGRTTGAHLHFTVWYKNKPVNPALFLW